MLQSLRSKVRHRLYQKLSGYAGKAVSHPAVRQIREKRYAHNLARYGSALPKLASAQETIVADLKRGGVSQLPLDALSVAGSADMIKLAQRLVESEMSDFLSQASAGRKFLMMRPEPVLANPDIYRFGLNPVLLDLAEAYLGLPVAYDGVSIQYTLADGEESATRLWHRDREDRKMLKLIVYLNDVGSDGGPFELLPRAFEPAAQHQHYIFTPDERRALDAGEFGKPVTCEGPTGTAIFADTASFFHRGKPAVRRERSAIFFSYFTQRPEYPFFCDRSGMTRRQIAGLVRDLPLRQRNSATWWNSLSLPMRLIPSAPIF